MKGRKGGGREMPNVSRHPDGIHGAGIVLHNDSSKCYVVLQWRMRGGRGEGRKEGRKERSAVSRDCGGGMFGGGWIVLCGLRKVGLGVGLSRAGKGRSWEGGFVLGSYRTVGK